MVFSSAAKRVRSMQQDKYKLYDVRPHAEWQILGSTSENRPTVAVAASEVPELFPSPDLS